MRRHVTCAALSIATSVALMPAASAEPVDPIDETSAGVTCGLTSTNDETGQVVQDPNTQTGVVYAGPWVIPRAFSVTMTCTISVGDRVIGPGDTAVSQPTAGPVGVLTSPVSYQVGPGISVWLCTSVSWTYSDGSSGSWGGFCIEVISVEI